MTEAQKNPIVVSSISNAGGTAKTTLTINTAYELADRGYHVVILELDPSGSMKRFVGLPPAKPGQSSSRIFSEDFEGDYPLIPIWADHLKSAGENLDPAKEDRLSPPLKSAKSKKGRQTTGTQPANVVRERGTVSVIQGGSELNRSIQAIEAFLPFKYFTLQKVLEAHRLNADVILLDTPATLQPMGLVALAASDFLLVTMKLEWKDVDGAAELIKWYKEKCIFLGIKSSPPPILGFVPTRVDLDYAVHRNLLGVERVKSQIQKNSRIEESKTLPHVIQRMGYRCFPFVRESAEFINASARGLPLRVHQPKSDILSNLAAVADRIAEEIEKRKEEV